MTGRRDVVVRRHPGMPGARAFGRAWLVTAYDFPGWRVLSWVLLLPLAVPTCIVADAYLDLLHPMARFKSR